MVAYALHTFLSSMYVDTVVAIVQVLQLCCSVVPIIYYLLHIYLSLYSMGLLTNSHVYSQYIAQEKNGWRCKDGLTLELRREITLSPY